MLIKTSKTTADFKEIALTIQVEKVLRPKLLSFQTEDVKTRNNWCIQGRKPCIKYDSRPCCPPRVPMFEKFPAHSHAYLVAVVLTVEDYYLFSPRTAKSPQRKFLFLNAAHKITRAVSNSIVTSFDGQAFRVGGCLGCGYAKNGKCRRLCPPLEGTGINVVDLAKDVFDLDLSWGMDCTQMAAIGAIYTDEIISKSKFKEVVSNVCSQD